MYVRRYASTQVLSTYYQVYQIHSKYYQTLSCVTQTDLFLKLHVDVQQNKSLRQACSAVDRVWRYQNI